MELISTFGISDALVMLGSTFKDFLAVLALCSLRMYVVFFVSPITDDQP